MTSYTDMPPSYLTHWPDMTLVKRERWTPLAHESGLVSAPSQFIPPTQYHHHRKDFDRSTQYPQSSHPPLITKIKKPRLSRSERKLLQHPYSRKISVPQKLRSLFDHDLEHHIFTPAELELITKTKRRGIYVSSLERHIDTLHAQLEEYVSTLQCHVPGALTIHPEVIIGNILPTKFRDTKRFMYKQASHMRPNDQEAYQSMIAALEIECSVRRSKIAEMTVAIEKLKALLARQCFRNFNATQAA
ncbi:hypothetical protein CVT26_003821 [Gymnopilus dilepis]|uniref:Uncharacterized protein n=1 Tax=Gymnopilus dilepis TaxID=231916 RepID=A0A409YM84_9AGAR|nr:hypothetical protein CVT26_003821 [Gymnopilus dilepis]